MAPGTERNGPLHQVTSSGTPELLYNSTEMLGVHAVKKIASPSVALNGRGICVIADT